MSMYSIIKKQELTLKQKAILLFWQGTKGRYTKEPMTIQDQIDYYVPVYTVQEMKALLDFSYNEALEFYQWDGLLKIIYAKDIRAQKYYYQMISHINMVVCGLPYMLLYGEGRDKRLPSIHFSSPILGENITYEQEVQTLYYCCYNFLLITYTVVLLNLFMDNAYDPLPCLGLLKELTNVNAISTDIIQKYMFGIDPKGKIPTFPSIKEFYALHKPRIVADAVADFIYLTETFERFGLYIPETRRQMYLEEADKVIKSCFNPAP